MRRVAGLPARPTAVADASPPLLRFSYERACSNAEQHGAPPPPPQLKELLQQERFVNNVWQGRI